MKTKQVSVGKFFQDTPIPAGLTITAENGEELIQDNAGRLVDRLGRCGYQTRFSGLYVCYTCGHMCDCGGEW